MAPSLSRFPFFHFILGIFLYSTSFLLVVFLRLIYCWGPIFFPSTFRWILSLSSSHRYSSKDFFLHICYVESQTLGCGVAQWLYCSVPACTVRQTQLRFTPASVHLVSAGVNLFPEQEIFPSHEDSYSQKMKNFTRSTAI